MSDDIFLIKDGEKILFYAPSIRILGSCDEQFAQNINIKKILDLGILPPDPQDKPFHEIQNPERISLVIYLTYGCNMACRYCYADSGRSTKIIDFNMVKDAINYLIKLNPGFKQFSVTFHGGGEPFFAFEMMKKIISYLKDITPNTRFHCTTNGVLNENQIEFIIQNKIDILISLDGTPDVQNYQRPLKGNKASSDFVCNVIKTLQHNRIKTPIRTTISDYSVDRMEEITRFFINLGIDFIHFEPLYSIGRAERSSLSPPDSKIFVDHFIKSFEIAEKENVEVFCSNFRFGGGASTFCNLPYLFPNGFALTTDGYISGCLEVVQQEDKLSNPYLYGQYMPQSHEFIIDLDRLNKLKNHKIDNISMCQKCIAKYDCAGDCSSKSFRRHATLNADLPQQRCEIQKELLIYALKRIMANIPIKIRNVGYEQLKEMSF